MEWLSVADLVVSIIMVLVTIALVFITRRYVIPIPSPNYEVLS